MNTMAVVTAKTAATAELVESGVEVVMVVPSAEACILIASSGATTYGNSIP